MSYINNKIFTIATLVFKLATAKDGNSIVVDNNLTSQTIKYKDRCKVIRQLSNRIYAISSMSGFEINHLCKSPRHMTMMNILNLSNCEIGGSILIGDNKITISSEEDRVKVLVSLIKTEQLSGPTQW